MCAVLVGACVCVCVFEFWDTDEFELPRTVAFESKLDTGLWEFLKVWVCVCLCVSVCVCGCVCVHVPCLRDWAWVCV